MPKAVVTWRGDEWIAEAMPCLNNGLAMAAAVCADQAVRNFGTSGGGVVGADKSPLDGGPKTGRSRKAGRAFYKSSPPGGFPGVRTSYLRNSITFVHPDKLGTPLRAAFGTAVKYGKYLEFGAIIKPKNKKALRFEIAPGVFIFRKKAVLKARPWIVRSANQALPIAERVFVKTVMDEMRAKGLIGGQVNG